MEKAYADYKLDELLGAIAQHDEHAFSELYNRYKKPLYIFALRKLGDPDVVDDVLQDLFVSIWTNREKIRVDDDILPYLFVSLRNKIIDCIAKSKNRATYEESLKNYAVDFDNKTDFKVRSRIFKEQIDLLLDQYPSTQREIFKMRFYKNMSNKEIAEELEISEKTVRNQLSMLLKVLRQKIKFLVFLIF